MESIIGFSTAQEGGRMFSLLGRSVSSEVTVLGQPFPVICMVQNGAVVLYTDHN